MSKKCTHENTDYQILAVYNGGERSEVKIFTCLGCKHEWRGGSYSGGGGSTSNISPDTIKEGKSNPATPKKLSESSDE